MTATNPIAQMASYYASAGWKIMAVHGLTTTGLCTCGQQHSDPKDIGKHPATRNGQDDASSETYMVESWWRINDRYNSGVSCRPSGFFVVDIDPRYGGFETLDRFEELVDGQIPDTVTALTGMYQTKNGPIRGKHLYFKADESMEFIGKLETIAKDLTGIDIKHKGYVLLPPSNHLSGVQYEWAPGHAPWEIEMAAPSPEMLGYLQKKHTSSGGGDWSAALGQLEWNGQKIDLDRFINEGIEEGSRAVDIYAMTCALANKYGTSDLDRKNIETMMIRFNHEMVRPPLELEGQGGLLMHVHRAIDFVAQNPKEQFISKKIGYDIEEGVRLRDAGALANFGRPSEIPDTSDVDDRVMIDRTVLANVSLTKDVDALLEEDGGVMGDRTNTDTGNGRRLVDAFGNVMRYTPGLGWFYWNQEYWMPDVEELAVRELTKRLGSIIAAEAVGKPREEANASLSWSKQAKSNARQAAAIEAATSDPRVGVPVEHWDRDPYLFGVANGVVDLRTGELMRGRPDLHITRRAPVMYRAGHPSPRFQEFLNYATYGDQEYQEWLQKAAGYTLTGLRTYDIMLMVYGPPGTGKNVFVEALVKLMGTKQYAFPLDSMILAQGDGRTNASDMYHWAELRGRRMIWVDELPESERLKENSVKKLTGSSEISARSPGEKPFTFESQGKLWITTNHRPIITDEAMWRRIRPIPWMHQPEVSDPTLKAYLHDPEGGLPGILSWAVEGAMKLLASKELDALGWCHAVADAAEMYRQNEDRMGMFLLEETEEDVVASTPIKQLFMVYQEWSNDRGERPMSQIAFTRKMTDRGVNISGSGGRAIVLGRRIRPRQTDGPVDYSFLERMARD